MILKKYTNSDHDLMIYNLDKNIREENLRFMDKKQASINSKKRNI